jgi:hypothetical protein
MVYHRHRFSWERELEVQRAWMRAQARGFSHLQSTGSWFSWERELEVQRAWMRAQARGFSHLQSIGSWFSWERELEVQRAWMRAQARGFSHHQSIGSWFFLGARTRSSACLDESTGSDGHEVFSTG